jgi:hypothetical protein
MGHISRAQGAFEIPIPEAQLQQLRDMTPAAMSRRIDTTWVNFGAPWVTSRSEFEAYYTKDRYIHDFSARHPSVFRRQGTSFSYPPHVPSLIGIQDRKYLDSTGLVRNRSIGI